MVAEFCELRTCPTKRTSFETGEGTPITVSVCAYHAPSQLRVFIMTILVDYLGYLIDGFLRCWLFH